MREPNFVFSETAADGDSWEILKAELSNGPFQSPSAAIQGQGDQIVKNKGKIIAKLRQSAPFPCATVSTTPLPY